MLITSVARHLLVTRYPMYCRNHSRLCIEGLTCACCCWCWCVSYSPCGLLTVITRKNIPNKDSEVSSLNFAFHVGFTCVKRSLIFLWIYLGKMIRRKILHHLISKVREVMVRLFFQNNSSLSSCFFSYSNLKPKHSFNENILYGHLVLDFTNCEIN